MSKTRNQRRRDLWRWVELILTGAMVLVLIASLITAGIMWKKVEDTTRQIQEFRESYPVIYVGSFIPDDFDLREYEDACWRYAVENDLILPQFIAEGGE